MRVVLASASPARRAVLQAAGIDPLVEIADVGEKVLLAATQQASPAAPGSSQTKWPGRWCWH